MTVVDEKSSLSSTPSYLVGSNLPLSKKKNVDEKSSLSSTPSSCLVGSNLPLSKKKKNGNDFHDNPSLDPYIGKLERYELFCTNQSYYLVGCNKQNSQYRVIKMDRTLIEREDYDNKGACTQQQPTQVNMSSSNTSNMSDTTSIPTSSSITAANPDATHNSKPTLRTLSEFLTEDPNIYSQSEIQDMLDMIHDGNRLRREDHRAISVESSGGGGVGGGLKPSEYQCNHFIIVLSIKESF